MGSRTSSINLATANPRAFTGNVPKGGKFTIQMKSTDLSADTTFRLQYTLNDVDWDTAVANDSDVTDVLVANAVMLKSFEADPSIASWRILFDGSTAGTVSYIVNGL